MSLPRPPLAVPLPMSLPRPPLVRQSHVSVPPLLHERDLTLDEAAPTIAAKYGFELLNGVRADVSRSKLAYEEMQRENLAYDSQTLYFYTDARRRALELGCFSTRQ